MIVFTKKLISTGMASMLLLALLSTPVYANPFGGRHVREGGRQGDGQFQPQNPRDGQRFNPQRNDGREADRPQRLSPDERRQLRRDIQDAGREIYPRRR